MFSGFTDGIPCDYVADKPTKSQEKAILDEMDSFVEFMERFSKTHAWDEKSGKHIPLAAAPSHVEDK